MHFSHRGDRECRTSSEPSSPRPPTRNQDQASLATSAWCWWSALSILSGLMRSSWMQVMRSRSTPLSRNSVRNPPASRKATTSSRESKRCVQPSNASFGPPLAAARCPRLVPSWQVCEIGGDPRALNGIGPEKARDAVPQARFFLPGQVPEQALVDDGNVEGSTGEVCFP